MVERWESMATMCPTGISIESDANSLPSIKVCYNAYILPKVTGYADNMMVDGIAYRIKHATILAIGIEPDGKIQGLHSIGNYATIRKRSKRATVEHEAVIGGL